MHLVVEAQVTFCTTLRGSSGQARVALGPGVPARARLEAFRRARREPGNRERLAAILVTALEGVRVLAVLLSPFTPKASAKLWAAIGGSLGELADQSLLEAGHKPTK